MDQSFTIRFDSRTKGVIVQALVDAQTRAAAAIIDGDYSEESLLRAEELSQVLRGVLNTRPETPQEEREPREAAPDILDNLPE